MTIQNKVKVLAGIADNSRDDLIDLYVEQAQDEFLQYCNRQDIPASAQNVIVDMVVVKYNLNGTEGLQSQSFSGASETYGSYPEPLIRALNHYRKVRLL